MKRSQSPIHRIADFMRCCFAAICRFICCPFCSCCWVCYSLSSLLEWLLMLLYAAWCVVLLEAVWSAQSLEVGCWFLWLLCTISWFVASSLAGWFPAAGCCCFLLYCRLAFLTDDCFSEEEPCCCLLACVQLWPVLQRLFPLWLHFVRSMAITVLWSLMRFM